MQLILSSDGASPVQIRVDAVPHFAAELPHGAIRSRLLAITDVRALLPMVTVGGSAQSGSLHDDTGKIVVRASLGRGLRVVHPKGGPLPPDVLEVHALRGYESYARELRDQFDPTGRSLHPGDALQLAAAMARVDLAGFDTSPSVPLDRTMPALSGTCAVLRDLADTMERTWQGTIDRVEPVRPVGPGSRRSSPVVAYRR